MQKILADVFGPWLLLVEALLALLVFVGIVWWTMFSGRRNGERRLADRAANDSKS